MILEQRFEFQTGEGEGEVLGRDKKRRNGGKMEAGGEKGPEPSFLPLPSSLNMHATRKGTKQPKREEGKRGNRREPRPESPTDSLPPLPPSSFLFFSMRTHTGRPPSWKQRNERGEEGPCLNTYAMYDTAKEEGFFVVSLPNSALCAPLAEIEQRKLFCLLPYSTHFRTTFLYSFSLTLAS